MTAQEIIENALLMSQDVDGVGRTRVEMLAHLSSLRRQLYDYVVTWQLFGIPGYQVTKVADAVIDSSGRYTKPADFYRPGKIWTENSTEPAMAVPFDWLENIISVNSAAYGDTSEVVYAIDGDYIHFRPISVTGVNIYYYPTLGALSLSSDFPGSGMLDDLAISWLYDRIVKNDRFDVYDAQFSNSDKKKLELRARIVLSNYSKQRRAVLVPIHNYSRTRSNSVRRIR